MKETAKPKIYSTACVFLRRYIFLILRECDLPDGLREVISRATNGESLTQNEIKVAGGPRVRKMCVPPQKLYKQCARFNYCRSNSRGEQLIPRSAARRFYLRELRDFHLKGVKGP